MKFDPKEQTANIAEEAVPGTEEKTATATSEDTDPEGEGENED